MPVWNVCPHCLQDRLPTPAFLSMETETEFSLLQKLQRKLVARGSRLRGPVGLRPDFLRLP